jgi:hypothetical protein
MMEEQIGHPKLDQRVPNQQLIGVGITRGNKNPPNERQKTRDELYKDGGLTWIAE